MSNIEKTSQVLYEMYKVHWMERIASEMVLDELRNYYEAISEYPDSYSNFDDYIFENGYCGSLYVCFDEFCQTELLDQEFMYELIGECEPLKKAYEKLLKEEE